MTTSPVRFSVIGMTALSVAFSTIWGSASTAIAASAPQPVDIGTLGGNISVAAAVNDAGQVVGSATLDGETETHAFLWSDADGMTDLGTLGGNTTSTAQDISETGVVVGINGDEFLHRAYIWTPTDGMRDLGTLPGLPSSSAIQVNASGHVVGVAQSGGPNYRGFYWTAEGGMVDVGTLGGHQTTAVSINDADQVVGTSRTSDNTDHGFFWTPTDGQVDIGTLGGDSSSAVAINEQGVVAGSAQTADGNYHAITWTSSGGMVDVAPESGSSGARAINNSGAVVGVSDGEPTVWMPNGTTYDLGSLPGSSQKVEPRDINNDGEVVGFAVTAANETHGFSWTQDGGLVDLGALPYGDYFNSYSDTFDVNNDGLIVGSSFVGMGKRHAVIWSRDTTTAPEVPRAVTAAAGDAKAVVSWAPPLSDGGSPITSYAVTASSGGGQVTVGGSATSATMPGLTNDAPYTFTVTATNDVGTSANSAATGQITPRAGAISPAAASGSVSMSEGGTVSTGTVADSSHPVVASVDVPPGTAEGTVSIAQSTLDINAPSGFSFFGQQINIVAPQATVQNPLVLSFMVDGALTEGQTPTSVQLFRTEGSGSPQVVPNCTSATDAVPDPCVASRQAVGGNDIKLTVRTSSASAWDLAVRQFPFTGFISPVKNSPTVNRVTAGSTVNLKFGLGGNRGLGILHSGSPTATTVSCTNPASVSGAPAATVGKLSYDSKNRLYQYSWKTSSRAAGSCVRVDLSLIDDTRHSAVFRLTK